MAGTNIVICRYRSDSPLDSGGDEATDRQHAAPDLDSLLILDINRLQGYGEGSLISAFGQEQT